MKLGKTTKKDSSIKSVRQKRGYEDACAAAHALDIVGDRWALLVVRELMFGPRRFTDLRAALPGISANVLTQRLEELEAAGVLIRRRLLPPAAAWVYELTEWGYASEPIFQVLGRWGALSLRHDPTLPMTATSLMLSFRTMIDRAELSGWNARIAFRLEADSFVATLDPLGIHIARGEAGDIDLGFQASASSMVKLCYGKWPIDALIAEGELVLTGDRALAERFVDLFHLPEKAVSGIE